MSKPTYVICDAEGNELENSEELLTSMWGSAYLYNSILNRLPNDFKGKVVKVYIGDKKHYIYRKGYKI